MKKISSQTSLLILITAFLVGFSNTAKATTFTAVANGNFSAGATWGGTAPSANITGTDAVVIPIGITVTLDENVTLNNALATLTVSGSLTGSNYGLNLTAGTLAGAGSVNINSLVVGTGGLITSTGAIAVNSFTNNQATLQIAASVSVADTVTLNAGLLTLLTGGSANLASGATIDIAGGTFTSTGGLLNMGNTYNLLYTGSVSTIGPEVSLGSSTLQNVGINLSSSSNQITLSNNLTVGGALNIQQGTLVVGSNTLTINGTVSTAVTGSVSTTSNSNIVVNGSGNVGSLSFNSSGNTVGNLTVNIGSTGMVSIGSALTVNGALSLNNGSLNVSGQVLNINGTVSVAGTGNISGNSSTSIDVTGTSNSSVGTLSFSSSGNTIDSLNVIINGSGSVSLGSTLTVSGSLTLNGGSLNLNGQSLTLGGTVNSYAGTISGTSSSNLALTGSGNVGSLMFTSGSSTLGNLTVNLTSNGSVLVGSNLTVAGTLNLAGGSLALSGFTYNLGGTVTGSGTITGNPDATVTLTGSGNVGTLTFTSGSQTINNLTTNITSNGSVTLGSNLTVGNTLSMVSGMVNLGNNNLTIGSSGSITGASATSYVVTNGTGTLTMTVNNSGGSGTFQVGTSSNFAPVTVTNNSSGSGTFSVLAHPGVFANGTTGTDISTTQSVVNTSWDVSSSITSGANVNLEMFWNSGMQVNGFDNTQAYVSHYTGGAWNTNTLAAATAHGGGTYSLSLNGVTSFSPFAVFDKNTVTGIENVKAEASFSVYPNPATDHVSLSIPQLKGNTEVKVSDVLGNQVHSFMAESAVTNLDISTLAPGIYFVTVDNNSTKQFIKK